MWDTLLPLLSEHLSLGDLFRLSRACHIRAWPTDVAHVVTRRMGLRGRHDMASIGYKMRTTRRCVECGVPTRRSVRACVACTTDPRSFVALMTRAEIFEVYPHVTLHRLRRRLVPVPYRGPLGRYYYRARGVRAAFGGPQTRIA